MNEAASPSLEGPLGAPPAEGPLQGLFQQKVGAVDGTRASHVPGKRFHACLSHSSQVLLFLPALSLQKSTSLWIAASFL